MIRFNSTNFSSVSTTATYQQLIRRRFFNRFDNLDQFHQELDQYNFDNKELVRPSFDTYFMRLAELAASRSNCMKKGNGAIIARGNRVVSTGYNGTPFGTPNCNEGGCQRCNNNVA